MLFEHTKVFNFEGAFRGMRNPKASWHLSDSDFSDQNNPVIGPNDLRLAQTLIRGGSVHRKFMRQIFVCVDITAPDYFWKEFSTYKVATVENSTSTMHKIQSKKISLDSFETGDYVPELPLKDGTPLGDRVDGFISTLEELRRIYLETKDRRYWKELVRWDPMAWLYKRTVTMSYENLLAMCSPDQRRNHKLTEWSGSEYFESFVAWARTLPCAQELIFLDELDAAAKREEEEQTRREYEDNIRGIAAEFMLAHADLSAPAICDIAKLIETFTGVTLTEAAQ